MRVARAGAHGNTLPPTLLSKHHFLRTSSLHLRLHLEPALRTPPLRLSPASPPSLSPRDRAFDNANLRRSSISSLSRSSFAYVSIASPVRPPLRPSLSRPSLSSCRRHWYPHRRRAATTANRSSAYRLLSSAAGAADSQPPRRSSEVLPPRHGHTNVLVTCLTDSQALHKRVYPGI